MLVVIALCDFEGYKMESAPSLKAEDTSQGTQKTKEDVSIKQIKEQNNYLNENDQEEKTNIAKDKLA